MSGTLVTRGLGRSRQFLVTRGLGRNVHADPVIPVVPVDPGGGDGGRRHRLEYVAEDRHARKRRRQDEALLLGWYLS